MKKIFAITIMVLAAAPFMVSADNNLSTDQILNEIKQAQNVTEISQTSCDKVTDEQFEKLGDAVMGVMHPDEKQHELMDQMMGGEGSASLKAMHILMGQRYLGCAGNVTGGGMMGNSFGNFGMMSNWSDYANFSSRNNFMNSMMGSGWSGFGWLGFIFMILFWALVVLGIILLIKFLANQGAGKTKSVLDILKERYAKGEISKQEFESKKKDLEF